MTATAVRKDETTIAKVMRAAPGPIFEERAGHILCTKAGVSIDAGGRHMVFEELTELPMPALEPGRNYYVWHDDRTIGVIGAEGVDLDGVLGGFHYAPGGNAAARAGGDEKPSINPLSIWDIGFKPACADPRGMAYVAGVPGSEGVRPFWVDLYLLNTDHFVKGTSVHGALIADGNRNKPLIEASGRVAPDLNYATATAIMEGHGKQLLSFTEFSAAAYGVIERTAAGDRPKLTGLDAARTSRCGMMQATGNLYVWGHDGDPDTPRASLFGGYWVNGGFAGSRYAYVGYWPGFSYEWIGARGRSDHLSLD
jgi:hypothetical protein